MGTDGWAVVGLLGFFAALLAVAWLWRRRGR